MNLGSDQSCSKGPWSTSSLAPPSMSARIKDGVPTTSCSTDAFRPFNTPSSRQRTRDERRVRNAFVVFDRHATTLTHRPSLSASHYHCQYQQPHAQRNLQQTATDHIHSQLYILHVCAAHFGAGLCTARCRAITFPIPPLLPCYHDRHE